MSTPATAEHVVDKSTWPRGPWDDEPDHVSFEHKGVPCIIHRSPAGGALCGYAAVPPGHPWHGKGMSDVDANVNGGLSYAEACQGAICHVPKPGEPDNVWWLGFDCAHTRDVSPVLGFMRHGYYATYKTIAFVRSQCERLAEQIIEAAGAEPATLIG